MNTLDRILELIEDHGPQSMESIRTKLHLTKSQAMNWVYEGTKRGQIHNSKGTRLAGGEYKLGPPPGWLPDVLPPCSVWAYAQRIGAQAARAEIPKL